MAQGCLIHLLYGKHGCQETHHYTPHYARHSRLAQLHTLHTHLSWFKKGWDPSGNYPRWKSIQNTMEGKPGFLGTHGWKASAFARCGAMDMGHLGLELSLFSVSFIQRCCTEMTAMGNHNSVLSETYRPDGWAAIGGGFSFCFFFTWMR